MGMVHLRHLRRERPERSDVHLPGASGHDRPVPNGFPPFFTTPSITVFVAVSQVKYAAFVSAGALTAVAGGILAAAAIAAAIIGVGDIAAAVFVGIASGFEAAALIAGGVAQDPPIEDRRYRLLYEPVAVRLPDTGEEIQPLVRFAQAVFAVIAHVEALGATDSRIAGARAARARKALENQTNHFEKVRKELPRLAREVRDALPDAAAFFSERSPTPAKADEAIQVLNHDLPLRAQMLKAWQDAGANSKDFDTLTQLTAMPEFGQVNPRSREDTRCCGSFDGEIGGAGCRDEPLGLVARLQQF
jgi:hypothetical protein